MSNQQQGRLNLLILEMGETTRMISGALRAIVERPFPWREVAKQLYTAGVKSYSIILLTGLFCGAVLALHGGITLERFGAKSMIGNTITASLMKELGPVLAALMVCGRVGAGYASELGTMAVTEQVHALRALGVDPRRWLVMPRVVALVIMMPILTIYTDAVGLFGGFLVCVYSLDFTPLYYIGKIQESLNATEVFGGLLKGAVFGFLIATLSCRVGLSAHGGSEAVGKVTKIAVVASSVAVLISDYMLARIIYWIF